MKGEWVYPPCALLNLPTVATNNSCCNKLCKQVLQMLLTHSVGFGTFLYALHILFVTIEFSRYTQCWQYRLDTLKSNTVYSKLRANSIFWSINRIHFGVLHVKLCSKYAVKFEFHIFRRKTLPTNDFELTVPNLC